MSNIYAIAINIITAFNYCWGRVMFSQMCVCSRRDRYVSSNNHQVSLAGSGNVSSDDHQVSLAGNGYVSIDEHQVSLVGWVFPGWWVRLGVSMSGGGVRMSMGRVTRKVDTPKVDRSGRTFVC